MQHENNKHSDQAAHPDWMRSQNGPLGDSAQAEHAAYDTSIEPVFDAESLTEPDEDGLDMAILEDVPASQHWHDEHGNHWFISANPVGIARIEVRDNRDRLMFNGRFDALRRKAIRRVSKRIVDDLLRCEIPFDRSSIEAMLTKQIDSGLNRHLIQARSNRNDCEYFIDAAGIHWICQPRKDDEDSIIVQLANFSAFICSEVTLDDGVSQRTHYEVQSRCVNDVRTFTLEAKDFDSLNWVGKFVSPHAVLHTVPNVKAHLRTAIRKLSLDIALKRICTHTGWTTIAGHTCYLHAGGVIAPSQLSEDIAVQLPPEMTRFALPPVAGRQVLAKAVRSSLGILNVGPYRITVPLLAVTARAVLGPSDFTVWISGQTGTRKSELAALCQRFFGATMDARRLPMNWASTENAIQTSSFFAKDTLAVIDDFVPRGTPGEIANLQKKADRVLRGQANLQGRSRCGADGNLKSTFFPRGTLLSTGEDVPAGQSIVARLVVLEVQPTDVDLQRLSDCQQLAAEGVFAAAMAGYIQFLTSSPLLGNYMERVEEAKLNWRGRATFSHGRHPDVLAHLQVGLATYLAFAFDVGAIDAAELRDLTDLMDDVLLEVGTLQVAAIRGTDPVDRFIETVMSALITGRAHLASMSGGIPHWPSPTTWGWRANEGGVEHACGRQIGWLDEQAKLVYLDPAAAVAIVRDIAGSGGEPFGLGLKRLSKSLDEKGLLIRKDADRNTYKIQVAAARHNVLAIGADFLMGHRAASDSR